jgi:hypothetical protein
MEPDRTHKNVEKSNGNVPKSRNEKGCILHVRAYRKLGHRGHRTDRSAGEEKQGSVNKNNDKKPEENQSRKVATYDRDYQ